MAVMAWKNIRLTEKQVGAVLRHGKAQYGAQTETEALRLILQAYFEERGLSFPMDFEPWGGPRANAGRPRKANVTFDLEADE